MTIHRPRHSLRRLQDLLTPSPSPSSSRSASNDSSHNPNTSNDNSTNSNLTSTSGLAWIVLGAAEHSSLTCSLSTVVQDLLAPSLLESQGITLLWHLHNTNPNARSGTIDTAFKPLNGGCCALAVHIHDITSPAATQAFSTLPVQFEPPQALAPQSHRKLELGAQDQQDYQQQRRKNSIPAAHFGADLKAYELIQTFEAPKQASRPAHGRCIVAVGISPAAGDEETLDQWYRSEQLDLMARNEIFVRCTRYRLLPSEARAASNASNVNEERTSSPDSDASNSDNNNDSDAAPTFLALHEYSSHQALLDYAIEHGQLVPETATSKRIFEGARKVERAIWEVREDYR